MTSWILYCRRGRKGALRHLFQDVVAADGFDDFFLGFLAILFVVRDLIALWRDGRFIMLGCGRSVGMTVLWLVLVR